MKHYLRYIILHSLLLWNISASSQVFSEVQKIIANDRQVAELGYSVAISGDYAVIGAFNLNSKNSVYIYQKNNFGQWIQIQKILSPENRNIDAFGSTVDIEGDCIIIGDFTYRTNFPLSVPGAAYIYKKDNNNQWQLNTRIVASDGVSNDAFGYAVSISGTKCIVGARQRSIGGAAYIFEEDSFGNWAETAKLLTSDTDPGDAFGSSVSINGNIAIIGATAEDHDELGNNLIINSGSVYVFEKNAAGVWNEIQKIVAPDRNTAGFFGYAVDLNNDRFIIGAGNEILYYSNSYSQSCSAYIYERNSTGTWDFVQKLSPPDQANPYGFSNSVGLSGNYAVVSAFDERTDETGNVTGNFSGATYIYKRQPIGTWNLVQRIVSSDLAADDFFGKSVAIEDFTILVGAPGEDEDENGQNTIFWAGSVYVFEACPPSLDTISHTTCELYTWQGQTYTESGAYDYETVSASGCDSIVTLLLTILPKTNSELKVTNCDAYTWNNQTYTQSGLYTYQTINANGCDSIATLDLTINQSNDENISHTACDAYFWNNQTYTQSGLYTFQTTNQDGCDSIISLDLTVNPSYQETITYTTCDDYTWNGQTYNQSGVYTYATTNQFDCDSILTLDLTINNTILTNEAQTACDVYFWNNQTYTQSGLYTFQTINADGCDSIATLDLTIFQSNDENISATACDSYFWNNQTYTQSGLYTFQTTNQYGCDSIISLDLTVNPSYQETITYTTCDDYSWNGQTYNQSGVYTFATITQFGCDSILTLDLTINNTIYFSETQTACDAYFWNNQTYTQSGSYTYQTINGDGCDSIATLELTIFESNSNNIFQSACQSFEYENQILTESGIYTFNLQNSFGCDSIVTLELEILDQFTSQSVSSCDQYIWPANGQTYLQSGIYTDTLQNVFGCDSVLQLDLNISPSFNIPDLKDVCDQYLWAPNNTTYTQSGFYQLDLKTAQGCDSILTLDLTVQPSFIQIDTVISSTEYTWQINNTTYATSGIYTEKWLTPADCDSIHQLLLTIKTDSDIYFPNIILPNSQNSNFTIFGSNSIELIQSLSVYDRWSNLVFHQQNFPPNQASLGWNGKFRGQPVIPGVYVWTAQIKLSDGSTLMKSGDVTVVE